MTPPVADAGGAGGKGGSAVDAAGVGGNLGSGGAAGVGGSANCDYPAGAEDAATTRFPIGSVVPNLKFFREDGSEVTFKDLRCNRKNRLLLWAVGGDLCAPCVARAKVEELPAWKALAGEGLFLMESFCGSNDLVGPMPFPEWRRKTGWPMTDMDGIMLVREPQMKPYYVMGRIVIGIPWAVTIDLETMKVVNVAGMGFSGKYETTSTLRARLNILPPRK